MKIIQMCISKSFKNNEKSDLPGGPAVRLSELPKQGAHIPWLGKIPHAKWHGQKLNLRGEKSKIIMMKRNRFGNP